MKIYTRPVGAIGTNCYIAADEDGKCAVIDPGAQPERLITFLTEHDLTPVWILLTHGHYDHIGAVKAIAAKFNCTVAIGEDDAEQLSDRSKSLAVMRGMSEEIFVMTPDRLLQDGDVVAAGSLRFTVIKTPGHTRGGVCYRCEANLFTGDTLFAGDVGRCDLYGGSYPAILESVKRLGALEGDLRVLPGHGPESTLERERRSNRYMQAQDE